MRRILFAPVLAAALLATLPVHAPAQVGAPYCFGVACPCGNDDPAAGCGNHGLDGDAATGATLEALAGTGDVLLDDVVLRLGGVAPGQLGLVFLGQGAVTVPFGDGLRCVGAGGGALLRMPVRAADEDGGFVESGFVCAARTGVPPVDLLPGATWNAQGWYRDPAGPCGGGFNLSNALPITFQASTGPVAAELAGEPLAAYPWFDHVLAIREGDPVQVAIDPARHWFLQDQTVDVYVVKRRPAGVRAQDAALSDVSGGPETVTVTGTSVADNRFTVDFGTLEGSVGTQVGVGYDVVVDVDRDGRLGPGDLVDGLDAQVAGFYVVRDTVAKGPYTTAEVNYNGGSFLLQNVFYPTNVAALGELPLVVVSHGNGHNYNWYDHIGHHLASYGYVVMSHSNNTIPGPDAASLTTLSNTDHFLGNLGTIAGGALEGHVDGHTIVWIGHSRGGEGIVRAYDRMFDGTSVPSHFTLADVKLLSSIAPTNFLGVNSANPHEVDYHLWVGSADNDVSGGPDSNIVQSFQLYERAAGRRASATLQGAGHGAFHNGTGSTVATGPCQIGRNKVHPIMQGYLVPLLAWHLRGEVPAREFLWRGYDVLRPPSAPALSDPCVVVHLELQDGPDATKLVLDDYQLGPEAGTSSQHGAVTWTVEELLEARLDDVNTSFTWTASDPFNGMTRSSTVDASRGAVLGWTAPGALTLSVVPAQRDWSGRRFLSLRVCQATRHPNTVAELGDLSFTVGLRDGRGVESVVALDAFGHGVGEPYQRGGSGSGLGWGNEFETFRLPLDAFLTDGSGLELRDVRALRFTFGGDAGAALGRIGLDDVELTVD